MCKTHPSMRPYCTDKKDAYKHRERCEIEEEIKKKEKIALEVWQERSWQSSAAFRDNNTRNVQVWKVGLPEVEKFEIFYWTTSPFEMDSEPSITFDVSSEKTTFVSWFVENCKDFYGYVREEELYPYVYWNTFILDPYNLIEGDWHYDSEDDYDSDRRSDDEDESCACENRHIEQRNEWRATMTFLNNIDDQHPSESYTIHLSESSVEEGGVWSAEVYGDDDDYHKAWADVSEMKEWFYERFLLFRSYNRWCKACSRRLGQIPATAGRRMREAI
jgi:hypothetical protein